MVGCCKLNTRAFSFSGRFFENDSVPALLNTRRRFGGGDSGGIAVSEAVATFGGAA